MQIHFVYILVLLLIGAAVHAWKTAGGSPARFAETVLLWLLVGYCGLPMLGVSLWLLITPEKAAHGFGFPMSPLIGFFAWAYLGMSLIALLALRYRGAYLVAPVVVWASYLGGATLVHLQEASPGGHLGSNPLEIFLAHGFIGLLLVAALVVSGAWRR